MADRDRELLGSPTLDLRDPRQVERWTHALDIFTADLVQAVAAVGDNSAAVLAYLRERKGQREP